MNGLAYEKDGVWHIHTGNQFASRTGGIAAGALGVDPKNVVLHQYFIGGGFCRRLDGDMVAPAASGSDARRQPPEVNLAPRAHLAPCFSRSLLHPQRQAGPVSDP